MPTDPSTDPTDVSDDVSTGGRQAAEAGSGDARGVAGQGRRRGRRGRRRRRGTPESRSDAEFHPRPETPPTSAEHPTPRPKRPSPADLADRAGGTRNGTTGSPNKNGSSKNGAETNGTAKPGPVNGSAAPVNGTGVNATGVNGAAGHGAPAHEAAAHRPKPGGTRHPSPASVAAATPTGKGTRVSAPKPSDMAVMSAKITKTGLTQDAAATPAPTRRRRGNRRPERAERLRTVRETSAGGLVISDLDLPVEELSAALIGRVDRRGRMMWSLPKGHIETGETAEQTAVREVAEETGIQGLVVAPLGKIDYWFVSEGRRIHKTVHHYLLRSVGGELSDEDYEVSEVAWVPLHELPRRLTYSDERRLARMARGVIADLAADPQRLAQSEAESSRTEPNAYERAAAARNQRRNEPPPAAPSRRRRRRPRRPAAGDG
ncbi:NUDIX domain-containing protein [Gordonia sp. L191]|uniref:NUDIX hydrolase n=1 Tax=unclassified Gordonia (in: high G+C Gram-positive bacteria) TaxID=2657482 RepID=UPI0009D51D93|nr:MULTISPECIES: NUDIX hydrolase [unclassified Gordonia (in: high G+C Gram-positive bacteria)]OPX08505.1 NUDIX hydrolase [Gordonia sp. i37]WHU46978.1 NUDIX domain-containing protein [Gordonia sp. L191]